MSYSFTNIRAFLTKGFNADELRRLCYDLPDFRQVYDEFASSSGKGELVDRIIEFADQRDLIDKLLAEARSRNPARYEKHQPYSEKPLYAEGVGILVEEDKAILFQLLSLLDKHVRVDIFIEEPGFGDGEKIINLDLPPPANKTTTVKDLTLGLLELFHVLEFIYYSAQNGEVRILQKGRNLLRPPRPT